MRLSPEQIESFLMTQNERYRKETTQFFDHHADDYMDYEGYPEYSYDEINEELPPNFWSQND
jgi:uncharacterized protein (UPF0276 family)